MKIRHIFPVVILLFIQGCADLFVDGPEINQNMGDFERAWYTTKYIYPFFEFKKIDWDSLYKVYKPLASRAKGDEIYNVIFDMLKELKDGHVELKTEGGFSTVTYLWARFDERKSFSAALVRKYVNKSLKLAGDDKFEYEIMDSNIGYLRLQTFTGGEWVKSFDAIMDYFRNTRSMIIDLRNNTGGSMETGDYIISRFVTVPVKETFYRADGTERTHFITPGGSYTYTKPLCILVNGSSFSAGEIVPELMRNLNNVKILGSVTGGGGGSNNWYLLPSHKQIRLPDMYFKRNDGQMVEWNGIEPDIPVRQTRQDVEAGQDKQLEAAIEYLNGL